MQLNLIQIERIKIHLGDFDVLIYGLATRAIDRGRVKVVQVEFSQHLLRETMTRTSRFLLEISSSAKIDPRNEF